MSTIKKLQIKKWPLVISFILLAGLYVTVLILKHKPPLSEVYICTGDDITGNEVNCTVKAYEEVNSRWKCAWIGGSMVTFTNVGFGVDEELCVPKNK